MFIRAPWLAEYGDAVEILAEVDGHPVAARQDNMLVIAFHPEIAGETRIHELLPEVALIVYFTRHGESVNNVADRALEPTPANGDSLSERGWEQARGLGERLRGEGIEAILASPYGRAQETAQAIGEVLGLPYETDEDLHEVRQSDAYRAASPNYHGTGHVSWMIDAPPDHAEPGAESFNGDRRARRPRAGAPRGAATASACCASRTGASCTSSPASRCSARTFSPAHLPALYRMSHINTGITLFERRRDYRIEGIDFCGWALLTWNDQAHL